VIRDIRYQAAILHNWQILLIQHREHASGHSYWLLPGGGREGEETPEQCLIREVQEETGLTITVERLLLDDPAPAGDVYQRFHTYLCRPSTFTASPGMEPEPEASAVYAIAAVAWFPLYDEASWSPQVLSDSLTAPLLRRIRAALGDAPDVIP
jgi:8-oxo-dGTP pyrophosphatase MutT (NUDIX family)